MAHRILLKFAAMRGELIRYPWRALVRVMGVMKTQAPDQVAFFYRGNPNLSFAPREIDAIDVKDTKTHTEIDLKLNFVGLQGSSTPLPIHFSEAIIQDDPDDSGLNEFYNFFNQNIYAKLIAIEEKYAYLPQVSGDLSDAMTQKVAVFAGFVEAKQTEHSLMPFIHGMLGNNIAQGNWCRMIAGLIGAEKAWVKERVPMRIKIPTQNLGKLGGNSTLCETLSLGAYITQAKNHLELHLAIENLETYLPNQTLFQILQNRVSKTLRENLFVSVVFHAKKAKTACLSHANPVGLGWSSMLGREQSEAYSVKLVLI